MLVAGLMSGTSADAIDVALVNIHASGRGAGVKLVGFHSKAFPQAVRNRLLEVAGGARSTAQEISQLNFLVGELFGRACLEACRAHGIPPGALQLIGSHGQTIHHQAQARREFGRSIRSTLQIGEPAVIAAVTGVTTIADFRPADMAAGGQGAPLVPYFDFRMYRHPRAGRIVLNIGGIANLTVVPAGAALADVRAFDTGPGNMVMDQLVRVATGGRRAYDAAGRLAGRGVVSESLLQRILREPFFAQEPPKSTGRELFGESFARRWFRISAHSTPQSKWNAVATATALTSASIVDAITRFVLPGTSIQECLVSGGGIQNVFLMRDLARRLSRAATARSPLRLVTLESAAIPSRAKEAAAFALLACETIHGRPSNVPTATGATRNVILGKVVHP